MIKISKYIQQTCSKHDLENIKNKNWNSNKKYFQLLINDFALNIENYNNFQNKQYILPSNIFYKLIEDNVNLFKTNNKTKINLIIDTYIQLFNFYCKNYINIPKRIYKTNLYNTCNNLNINGTIGIIYYYFNVETNEISHYFLSVESHKHPALFSFYYLPNLQIYSRIYSNDKNNLTLLKLAL